MGIINNNYNKKNLLYTNPINQKYYFKKSLEALSSSIFLLSCTTHFYILENSYKDLRKNFVKKIPFYSIIGILATLVGLHKKETIIKNKKDRTIEEQIKTHLILSQVGLSILSGIGIIRGIKQTKKNAKAA